jgi:hypothetical protein
VKKGGLVCLAFARSRGHQPGNGEDPFFLGMISTYCNYQYSAAAWSGEGGKKILPACLASARKGIEEAGCMRACGLTWAAVVAGFGTAGPAPARASGSPTQPNALPNREKRPHRPAARRRPTPRLRCAPDHVLSPFQPGCCFSKSEHGPDRSA